MTIGADTALHRITEAIDAIHSTASSHQRSFVIEVMGRHCGYLALMAGIAGGAEMILIPEISTPLEDVADCLSDAYLRGKAHGIILVAEGYKPGTQAVLDYLAERKDELERVRLSHVLLIGDDPLSGPGMEEHFRHNSLFVGPADRKAVNGQGLSDPLKLMVSYSGKPVNALPVAFAFQRGKGSVEGKVATGSDGAAQAQVVKIFGDKKAIIGARVDVEALVDNVACLASSREARSETAPRGEGAWLQPGSSREASPERRHAPSAHRWAVAYRIHCGAACWSRRGRRRSRIPAA